MEDEAKSRKLLESFIRDGSEQAFAQLIQGHMNFVYSSALRHVRGNQDNAREVAQAVFFELARKAHKVSRRENLTGWLYTTTRHIALKAMRTEIRRFNREQAYAMNNEPEVSSRAPSWREVEIVIDDALQDLPRADRDAVLLRFFRDESFKTIGAALGASENAARMRVERALDKLRDALSRRGVTCPSALLSGLIVANATTVAPGGLLAAALATPVAVAHTQSLAGAITFMTATKLKTVAAAVLLAASATGWIVSHHRANELREQLHSLKDRASTTTTPAVLSSDSVVAPDELARLRAERSELMRLRGEVTLLRNQARESASSSSAADRTAPPTRETIPDHREKIAELQRARMTTARSWYFALFEIAADKPLPHDLNGALAVKSNEDDFVNAKSANEFELTYQGSLNAIENPSEAIIMREKEPFYIAPDGAMHRTYLFADGHSEVRVATSLDDSAWEEKRKPRVHRVAAANGASGQ